MAVRILAAANRRGSAVWPMELSDATALTGLARASFSRFVVSDVGRGMGWAGTSDPAAS